MRLLAFAIGATAAGIIVANLLGTLLPLGYRFWPPGDDKWKSRLYWGCVAIVDLAIIVVGYFDWESWVLPRPASLVVGAVVLISGFVIGSRANDAFEDDRTDKPAQLYTQGAYAYSRHPQYLGVVCIVVGATLIADSMLVALLAASNVVWLLLLVRIEESWLRSEFGREYERYSDEVPALVGLRSLR